MVDLRSVRWLLVTSACLAVAFTTSCRNGAERGGGSSEQQVAALTTAVTTSTGVASGDQAKADAFSQQARAFAELAALERAQAVSMAATIDARTQATATAAAAGAKPVAGMSATSAAAAAPATSGSLVADGGSAAVAAAPTSAAKYEAHLQTVAALADRLGANAQRAASFHQARANRLAGVAVEGGAQ